ncbi:MAG: methyltransferase, partial [Acetivibrio ethanolgignens]
MLKYNGKQWDDNIVELRENKEKRRYMENIKDYIEEILSDGLKKAVFSDMRNKEYPYRRITLMKKEKGFQAEKQTEKQVFHDNLREEEVADYCEERLLEGFRQVNFWGESYEYSMKISKKGKLFFNRKQAKNAVKTVTEHNRRKNYLIEEGMVPPLVDMGVFTKDGKVVNAMYDKYKQINRFIEIIDDAVEKAGLTKLHIIDFGCGKSYLTFVIYYYLTEVRGL